MRSSCVSYAFAAAASSMRTRAHKLGFVWNGSCSCTRAFSASVAAAYTHANVLTYTKTHTHNSYDKCLYIHICIYISVAFLGRRMTHEPALHSTGAAAAATIRTRLCVVFRRSRRIYQHQPHPFASVTSVRTDTDTFEITDSFTKINPHPPRNDIDRRRAVCTCSCAVPATLTRCALQDSITFRCAI